METKGTRDKVDIPATDDSVTEVVKSFQNFGLTQKLTFAVTDFPVELLHKILMLLDWRMLLRCKTVCKALNTLIENSLVLRYQIELGADGLEDSPLSNLSVSERLLILLQKREAWRKLNWKKRVMLPSDGDCTAYELVGGVFAYVMPSEKKLAASNSFADTLGMYGLRRSKLESHRLSLTSLPSSVRKEGVKTRICEDIGVDCRDFAIDPVQDLIALVQAPHMTYDKDAGECKLLIHLRTISTNEKHPKAQQAILSDMLPCSFDAAVMQICDDILAVFMVVQTIPRVFVWQWTTGTLLVDEEELLTFRFADDFSLISNRSLMITTHFPLGAIKVYPFEAPNDTQWTPSKASLPLPPPTRAYPRSGADSKKSTDSPLFMHPRRHVLLYLPTLLPNNGYSEITSHTAPFTSGYSADKPFYTSEDARVHVMSVATEPQRSMSHSSYRSRRGYDYGAPTGGKATSFTVIVRNRVLVEYAEKIRREFKGEESHVQWKVWGPQNSRWLLERHNYAWLRFVHGSRFVRAHVRHWPAPRSQSHMQVLDFNVYPKRHEVRFHDVFEGPEVAKEERSSRCIVTEPTRIHEPMTFYSEVLSYLPYSEVTSGESFPYTGFMIDDERIVGLSANAFSHADVKHVEVFTF